MKKIISSLTICFFTLVIPANAGLCGDLYSQAQSAIWDNFALDVDDCLNIGPLNDFMDCIDDANSVLNTASSVNTVAYVGCCAVLPGGCP